MPGLGKLIRGILIGLPISVTFVDCVGYVAKVDGISMQPVLNPDGNNSTKDFVLLNRWSVRQFQIERGDIVSLASPRDPDVRIVKRVIALEGDTVRTLGYKKKYVNVPRGYCWVEGDHHRQSMDSNFFGPVSVGLITAKASHIVWPPNRWQKLKSFIPSDRAPLMSADAAHTLNMEDEESPLWPSSDSSILIK
ncbi:hypothetical protein CHUAL_005613 [Chamberlinius hualienensis]